jgi:nitrite reductase (NADH) small subunit
MGPLRWLLLGRSDGLRARVRRRIRQRLHPGAAVAGAVPAPGSRAPTGTPLGLGDVEVPAGFVAVARLGDLEDGTVREVLVKGQPVALARVGGRVHAMDGVCPHAGGPLAEGLLEGTTLRCPMHGWTFDVVTGDCHVNPEDRIRILELRVVQDVVCVAL